MKPISSIFARSLETADAQAPGYVANHYRYFRNRRGMGARAALEAARELPAAYVKGREYYGPSGLAGAPYRQGSDMLRFVDDTAALGLRFIGDADSIVSMRHTGWYTEDDGDNGETLRGGVWALPGRNGESRLLYGYREMSGSGEMNPGSAVLCVSDVVTVPRRGEYDSLESADETRDAARYADGIAESAAEDQREYERHYRAGREAAEKDAEAIAARGELLPLLAELRAERRQRLAGAAGRTAICAALRSRVDSLLETTAEARRERDSAWAHVSGSSEEPWKAGFMDEAADGFRRAVRLGFAKASDWRGAPEDNPCKGVTA